MVLLGALLIALAIAVFAAVGSTNLGSTPANVFGYHMNASLALAMTAGAICALVFCLGLGLVASSWRRTHSIRKEHRSLSTRRESPRQRIARLERENEELRSRSTTEGAYPEETSARVATS